jgi:hypothetical protein
MHSRDSEFPPSSRAERGEETPEWHAKHEAASDTSPGTEGVPPTAAPGDPQIPTDYSASQAPVEPPARPEPGESSFAQDPSDFAPDPADDARVRDDAKVSDDVRVSGEVGDEPFVGVIEKDVVVVETEEPMAHADAGEPMADADADEPMADADAGAAQADMTTVGTTPGGSEQWSEIKALFVDDPSASVKLAAGMVERAVDGLMASVRQRQTALDSPWQAGVASGTEELRNALQAYRGMFEQLDLLSSQLHSDQDRSVDSGHRVS